VRGLGDDDDDDDDDEEEEEEEDDDDDATPLQALPAAMRRTGSSERCRSRSSSWVTRSVIK
jgi:hypothetical protein